MISSYLLNGFSDIIDMISYRLTTQYVALRALVYSRQHVVIDCGFNAVLSSVIFLDHIPDQHTALYRH